MTKRALKTLFARLLTLPADINRAESTVLDAEWRRQEAASALQRAEDAVTLDVEKVNGKNAEQRAAQLRQLTEQERQAALLAERSHAEARLQLSALITEFAAMRSAARLLSEARR